MIIIFLRYTNYIGSLNHKDNFNFWMQNKLLNFLFNTIPLQNKLNVKKLLKKSENSLGIKTQKLLIQKVC